MSDLDQELKTYKDSIQELLVHEGKQVLIHQDEIIGIFDTYADALDDAYEKFGTGSFLIKKISATEKIAYFSRDLGKECQA